MRSHLISCSFDLIDCEHFLLHEILFLVKIFYLLYNVSIYMFSVEIITPIFRG